MREGQSKSPTDFGTAQTSLFPFFASISGQSFQTSVGTASSVTGVPFDAVGPVVVVVSSVCGGGYISKRRVCVGIRDGGDRLPVVVLFWRASDSLFSFLFSPCARRIDQLRRGFFSYVGFLFFG